MKNMLSRNIKIKLTIAYIFAAVVFSFGFYQNKVGAQVFGQVAGSFTTQLDEGDSGAEVTRLQTFLAGNKAIYPEGLVTGYFGTLTTAAVKRFQTAYGISAVGRVGPQTIAKLNSLIGISPGSGSTSGVDINAPIISSVIINRTAGTATIQWNTNELVKSRVYYGTTTPKYFETSSAGALPVILSTWMMPDDVEFQSNFNSVGLINLMPGVNYYYMIESVDRFGNVSVTLPASFVSQ